MTARRRSLLDYCEKARWALDRAGIAFEEDGHLPLFHYLATYRACGARTVPSWSPGSRARDSTDIIAWADAQRPGSLLRPIPCARRSPSRTISIATSGRQRGAGRLPFDAERRGDHYDGLRSCPAWERRLTHLAPDRDRPSEAWTRYPLDGVQRSRQKIEATFARVDELLRDGRGYLTGDDFRSPI